MDSKTAVKILTDTELVLPLSCAKEIRDAAKNCFLEDYDRLLETDTELEEKIFKVKGLMSELLTHKKKKVRKVRRKRHSLG